MSEESRYIYGIINEPKGRSFPMSGINGSDVSTINYADLAVVVSRAAITSYDRFNELGLASNMKAHQLILENLLKEYSVIPMSFGTIAGSEGAVRELLMTAYDDFKEALEEVDNRVELNVQVICDEAKIVGEAIGRIREAEPWRLEMSHIPESNAFEAKVAMGKLIAEAVDEMKRGYADDILRSLREVAEKSCPGKLAGSQMILNESFLVPRDREERFDTAVNRLAAKYESALVFKYIGPMPPYSFVDLIAVTVNAEALSQAMNLLNLGEEPTEADIRDAYRKLAREYHPDTSPGEPGGTERFKRITKAYELLTQYVRAFKPASGGTRLLTLDRIEDSIIITRRR